MKFEQSRSATCIIILAFEIVFFIFFFFFWTFATAVAAANGFASDFWNITMALTLCVCLCFLFFFSTFIPSKRQLLIQSNGKDKREEKVSARERERVWGTYSLIAKL